MSALGIHVSIHPLCTAQVLVSPFTTPAVLLLASTPFSVAGAAIPILMRGSMTWHSILLTAMLAGFGNSAG